jgi:hypothetical protein
VSVVGRLLAVLVALPFLAGGVTAAVSADRGEVVLTFADPAVVESSGLVVLDDLVVTVNDSGDSGRVFAVGPEGRTVGVTTFAESPTDVEALAPVATDSADEVWVGDIGDNAAARSSISVTRVPVTRGDRSGEYPTFELVYADGPRDAETLLVDPTTGRLHVVSKEIFGGTLYAAPQRLSADRPNVLEPVADALAVATDGAFWPDGRHLVVRGYGRAVVYEWPSMTAVADLDLPDQDQGEGIAVTADGRVLVSTEGQFTDVLEVPLPREVRQAVAPERPTSGADRGRPASAPAPVVEETRPLPLPLWLLLGGGAGVVVLLGLVAWAVRRR